MPIVDLAFPLVSTRIPQDHGYALYGALCRRLPVLHRAEWFAVHPIGGKPTGESLVLDGVAHLRLRLPVERIPEVLSLAGSSLDVAGARLQLGAPSVHPLAPAPSLDARLVVLTLTRPPRAANAAIGRETHDVQAFAQRYERELRRQLEKLGVRGDLSLRGRQRITIARRRVIGYSARVSGLDAASSVRLQESGLGGRRAMGCGVFRPTRGGQRRVD